MSLEEPQPMYLTLSIPKLDMNRVQEKISHLKQLLAYLETPNCRKFMHPMERLEAIKRATVNFRNILQLKQSMLNEK